MTRELVQLDPVAVRKTWIFLGAITTIETVVIALQPEAFFGAMMFRADAISPIGWAIAFVVTATFIAYTTRALGLSKYQRQISTFNLLGVAIAVPSAILEEVFFRMSIMNLLAHAHQGVVTQVLGSALAFGLVHALWGVPGGVRAVANATISTGALGVLLGVVFLASARAVLPCVVAHCIINLVLEPWMGYAYALRAQRSAE